MERISESGKSLLPTRFGDDDNDGDDDDWKIWSWTAATICDGSSTDGL